MNDEEKTVVLTEEQIERTLGDFYRCVAGLVGYEETEDTMYDCTKILVASNVRDAIIRAYQAICPNAPLDAILCTLTMSGPKVSSSLGCGEVAVQTGFICMRKE